MVAVSPVGPAQAASSQTFYPIGAPQTFNIPAGVKKLTASASGAGGASGGGSGIVAAGGNGGFTTATLDVTGQTQLAIWVGSKGSEATGGFNGGGNGGTSGANAGGGGGGASDVRFGSNKVLVAAGGGGGGANAKSNNNIGGSGGSGSQNGNNGNNGAGPDGQGGNAAVIANGNGGGGGGASNKGGSGGGGGGGYKAGNGGLAGGPGGVFSAGGAGGGGGSGNAFVVAGATNVAYGTGGSGNGSVGLSWIDITTNSLPEGVQNEVYPNTQLNATGGTGPYTWTSGALPTGMTLSAAGVLGGTPTVTSNSPVDFTVTDAKGLVSTVSLNLDIIAATPGVSFLLGGDTTNVGQTSATGNGTARKNTGPTDITGIMCKISPNADLSNATSVAATPNTATNDTPLPFTCPFTGLTPNTKYYTNVFATANSGATISGQSVDSFTTEPKSAQTFNAPFPKRIKYRGLTTLLSKTSKTSAGKTVQVKLSKSSKAAYDNRGDMLFYKLVKGKNGKRSVKTYGHRFYLKVTYYAAGTSTVDAYSQTRVYLVHK